MFPQLEPVPFYNPNTDMQWKYSAPGMNKVTSLCPPALIKHTVRYKFICPNDPLLRERNHFIKGSAVPNKLFSCYWLRLTSGLGIAEMRWGPQSDPAQCQIILGDL